MSATPDPATFPQDVKAYMEEALRDVEEMDHEHLKSAYVALVGNFHLAHRDRKEAESRANVLAARLAVRCDRWDHAPDQTSTAVVWFSWSDRETIVCVAHLADRIVSIALDHSYDRDDLHPSIELIRQDPALGLPEPPADLLARIDHMLSAARAWLDRNEPGWKGRSIDLDDAQRSEFTAAVRGADDWRRGEGE